MFPMILSIIYRIFRMKWYVIFQIDLNEHICVKKLSVSEDQTYSWKASMDSNRYQPVCDTFYLCMYEKLEVDTKLWVQICNASKGSKHTYMDSLECCRILFAHRFLDFVLCKFSLHILVQGLCRIYFFLWFHRHMFQSIQTNLTTMCNRHLYHLKIIT